jgi:hypothetical protein
LNNAATGARRLSRQGRRSFFREKAMKSQTGAPRQAALVPLYGVADKKPRPIDGEMVIVGRARGCDVVLDAPDVSSLHCVVYRWGGGFRLRDCASRTGTRVNGDPRKTASLHDGDVLQVGPFSFKLNLPDAQPDQPAGLSLKHQGHLQQSRRRLGELALRLRRRLQQAAEGKKASNPRKGSRNQEQRLLDLETAERDLAAGREALAKEKEAEAQRVQKVKAELAARLADADAQIRQRWQEFQQRCQAQEQRLSKTPHPKPDYVPLAEERRAAQEQLAALANQQREFEQMKEQFNQQQTAAEDTAQQQQAAIAQAEAGLKEQRQQLQAMIAQLKGLQEAIRKEPRPDAGGLTRENEQLKKQLGEIQAQAVASRRREELAQTKALRAQRLEEENVELRRVLEDLSKEPVSTGASDPQAEQQLLDLREENEQLRRMLADLEHQGAADSQAGDAAAGELRQENELLRQLLHEKDALFEEMKEKVVAASAPKVARGASDLENYEAELNQYRQQLEADRTKFNKEIEQLRVRNQELDEATREMELELSRERAEMARERQRLDRLRDEIRTEQERMNRDGAVRESLAPVQKLRDEMQKKNAGKPPTARFANGE